MPDDKPKGGGGKDHARAKVIGTALGALIVTVATSGGMSLFVNKDARADAAAAAEDAVGGKAEAAAKVQAAKAEAAVAEYIKREIEPKIEAAFDSVDADLDGLESDLDKCQADVREATILADTALRLVERSYGRRAVERVLGDADRAAPKPKPKAEKKADHKPKFKDYEQKIVVPELAD